MNYKILVNKDNSIDETFNIESLVAVGKHYSLANLSFTEQDVLLEAMTAKALAKLLTAANKIDKNVLIIPNSGYRSFEYQVKVMNYYIQIEGIEKASKRVAKPGTSEHHTGLAVDLLFLKDNIPLKDLKSALPIDEYIKCNACKYGFILRYPKGKENITGYPYEPWHLRYVGQELATYLYDNSLTLEEYYLMK